MQKPSKVFGSRLYLYFELMMSINQLCGIAFVILSGYLFNTMGCGIKWPSKGNYGGVNFHGIFMASGLVFFQGEALLAYRFYRYDTKALSKFVHVAFHLLAIAFFSTGLSAMIIHKNKSDIDHFKSVHSWIGIGVMFVYVVQFTFGLVNFLLPELFENTKKMFLPVHRMVGCVLFATSVVQATIGFIQYNGSYGKCPQDRESPLVCGKFNFILNFAIISLILFGVTVLLLVIPPVWQRKKTPEETE